MSEFRRSCPKPVTKLRQLASQCFDKRENYFHKALKHRLKSYDVKDDILGVGANTDLSNNHNLIQIKHINDLDKAYGQIKHSAAIMNSKGLNKIQKVIFVFGNPVNKDMISDAKVNRFWAEDGIRLIFATDSVDYLQDYEKAVEDEQDVLDDQFADKLNKMLRSR